MPSVLHDLKRITLGFGFILVELSVMEFTMCDVYYVGVSCPVKALRVIKDSFGKVLIIFVS